MNAETGGGLTAEAALIQRAEDACRPCGPCDSGLPVGCNCDPEPRAVIAGLLDALAALADRDAALARARAEGTLAERERIDDALARAGIDTDASGPIRAALHPAPSEGGGE